MLRQKAMYISLVIVTAALLLPGVASAQTGGRTFKFGVQADF